MKYKRGKLVAVYMSTAEFEELKRYAEETDQSYARVGRVAIIEKIRGGKNETDNRYVQM